MHGHGLLAGLALAARRGGAATEVVGASAPRWQWRGRGSGAGPAAETLVGPYVPPPRTTALGSLVHYITHAASERGEPANISFDLLRPWNMSRAVARDRRKRRETSANAPWKILQRGLGQISCGTI